MDNYTEVIQKLIPGLVDIFSIPSSILYYTVQ